MAGEMIEQVCEEIVCKRELYSLDTLFVGEIVDKIIKQDRKIKTKLESAKNFREFRKSREFKQIIKEARARLREVYGIFNLPGFEKRQLLLEKYIKTRDASVLRDILSSHKSTKERLPFYEDAYSRIFSLIPKPKKILDLGCGLNPLAYSYLPCKPEYCASELCQKDCDFLQSFFDGMNIKGTAFQFDLIKFHPTRFADYIDADTCFLLKVLDSLETLKKNISETIIEGLPCRYFVVSFPTQSIGGRKKIRMSSRNWFLKMAKRKGWKLESFDIPNEIFYIVEKK